MSQWFVVQTLPQREPWVRKLLSPLSPYLPVFKNERGRISVLFPGYIFVPEIAQWSLIKNTVGVRQLLMCGERPAVLADAIIQSWRGRERQGIVQLPKPPRFRKGQQLIIMRGMLRHHSAIYVGMSGKDREKVLIDLLGQWVPINIASNDLVNDDTRFRHRLRRSPDP